MPTAEEGSELICELIKKAQDRIVIMPGSGVRPHNIEILKEKTGAKEFHTAPRNMQKSKMSFFNENMKESDGYLVIDAESIGAMRSVLDESNNE